MFRFILRISPLVSHKNYGFMGLLLIILSFIHWFFPFNNFNLLLFGGLFYLGNILFFDYLSYEFSGFSLLHGTKTKKISHFLLLGLIFGVLLELYTHWLGKFWYYPYWDFHFYLAIFIPGFAAYAFYLIETYFGFKAIFEHFFQRKHLKQDGFNSYRKLFKTLGIIGSFGLGASTLYMIFNAPPMSTIYDFLSVNILYPSNSMLLIPLLIAVTSLWFLFEYLEYERHETSMLYTMIKGNYWPVISVFIAAWASAVLYEFFNTPSGLWRYANLPFENIALFNVPILAFVFWPFHYFPLFALYRILYKKETQEMWK